MRSFLISLLLSISAIAQTAVTPNCSFKFILSNRTQDTADSGVFGQTVQSVYQLSGGAAATNAINNTTCGADAWTIRYVVEGLTAVSVQLESAPQSRNASITNVNNISETNGTFAAFQGTLNLGSNPVTTINASTTAKFSGYYPYVRVNVASSTGTGSVVAYLDGWRSPQFFGVAVLPPGTNNVVTLAPPSSPQGTAGQYAVTNTATAITTNGSLAVKSLCISVLSTSTASAFIGFSSSVTTGNGFEIPPGNGICTQAITLVSQVFAIAAASSTTTIDWWGYN